MITTNNMEFEMIIDADKNDNEARIRTDLNINEKTEKEQFIEKTGKFLENLGFKK